MTATVAAKSAATVPGGSGKPGPARSNQTMTAECPECFTEMALPAGTLESEIVACPDCGAELEVVNVDPPELALAPEVAEDWGE